MMQFCLNGLASFRKGSGVLPIGVGSLGLFLFIVVAWAIAWSPQASFANEPAANAPSEVPGAISQAHKNAARDAQIRGQEVQPSAPVPSPSPSVKINPAEAKVLLKEFKRAQNAEVKAAEHRNKLELKELKAAQSVRLKEWENKEKEARHKFFAENKRGPDRRAYIKDFLERRKVFNQSLKEEASNRAHEQDVRVKAIKQDQSTRLKEFQDSLNRGDRPPQRLWPTSS